MTPVVVVVGVLGVVSAQALTGGMGVAYLAGGLVVAGLLERDGRPRGTVLGALVAWPLLLPLLGQEPPQVEAASVPGPLRARIDQTLQSLHDTLGDPAAGEVRWEADLDGLRRALYDADGRLALVDRLLAEDTAGAEAAAEQLRAARSARAEAVAAVLGEVQALRLQVGMAALAGDGDALSARLQELSARAATLAEIG